MATNTTTPRKRAPAKKAPAKRAPAKAAPRDVIAEIDELVEAEGMTEAEARAITAEIRGTVENLWALIGKAYTRRAWVALGYESWDIYASRELDTDHLRIPREDRPEVLKSLRASGLSLRAIQDVTGLGLATIHRGLEASVPNGTVDEPATVVGLDNRRRAARRKGPEPEPVADGRGLADRALSVPGATAPYPEGSFRLGANHPAPPRIRSRAEEDAQRHDNYQRAQAAKRARAINAMCKSVLSGELSVYEVARLVDAIEARWGSLANFEQARREAPASA